LTISTPKWNDQTKSLCWQIQYFFSILIPLAVLLFPSNLSLIVRRNKNLIILRSSFFKIPVFAITEADRGALNNNAKSPKT